MLVHLKAGYTASTIDDVLRAVSILHPADETTKRAVITTLGYLPEFGLSAQVPEPSPPAGERQAQNSPLTKWLFGVRGTTFCGPYWAEARDQSPVLSRPSRLPLPSKLIPLHREPISPEQLVWINAIKRAKPARNIAATIPAYKQPIEPLFYPRWTRAVIGEAAGVVALRGEIDLPRLVADVANERPTLRIPRCPVTTLSSGLLLLLDEGVGMQPFYRDMEQLRDQLANIVGRDRVRFAWFDSFPRKLGTAEVYSFDDLQKSILLRQPVLAVTDLGLSDVSPGIRLRTQAWLTFADWLARRGSSITLLVPYPRNRFPLELAHSISLVPWDRSTGVRSIRRRQRKAQAKRDRS